jgi:ketosteroid isomerase-like protein
MSGENTEVVRRAYEIFNRYHHGKGQGEDREVEAAWEDSKELIDPNLEYREDPNWPGASAYRGVDECRRVWDEYYEQLGEQRFDPEDFRETGDKVVVILLWSARGASSGTPTEMRQGHLHTLRDARIVKWEVFFDPDEALAAAGVRE